MKIKGGKIIGTGSQGCILYPQIPCKNKQINPKLVTKLFKFASSKDDLKELNPRILNVLRTIDPEEERFVYSLDEDCESYPLNELNPETVNDIMQCLQLTQEQINEASTSNIVFSNQLKVEDLGDYLSKTDLVFLKESIDILHEHNIVHLDLHINNIMRGSNDGRPRIIDFGEALYLPDIPQSERNRNIQLDNNFFNNLQLGLQNKILQDRKRERPVFSPEEFSPPLKRLSYNEDSVSKRFNFDND